MFGWWGRVLWVDLSRGSFRVWEYGGELARDYVGGRGFAVRILWDFLPRGVDPLSPENLLVVAAGPLTGLFCPSGSRVVVAAKSPLTGGYGDGSIGGRFGVLLRSVGYDGLVVSGASKRPVVLRIDSRGRVSIEPADDLWGLDAYEAAGRLAERYGRLAASLLIGPGGENLVYYATVVSEAGRSGGRPGMGAVMGSKRLKAIVVEGDHLPEAYDPDEARRIASAMYQGIRGSKAYSGWLRYGTMSVVSWANSVGVLPTFNFREGWFERADELGEKALDRLRVEVRGCPTCIMKCGHVVRDSEGYIVEIDYETIAMLGSNIGVARLEDASLLGRLADAYGLDSISLGSALAWAAEASEKRVVRERIEWGDVEAFKRLVEDIAYRRGLGGILADGVAKASARLGGEGFAVHVKGLPVSAYDCHAAPGMALAYATSPIGAHHKDAWVIAWEIEYGRHSYSRAKAAKVVELQRIRGGVFEVLTVCRFPWVEVGLDLDYYIKLFRAVTGLSVGMDYFVGVADRVYALIRVFWARELGWWSRRLDTPPERWFKEPATKGPVAGCHLDWDGFQSLLDAYYQLRGWDRDGLPTPETLRRLGLSEAIPVVEHVKRL